MKILRWLFWLLAVLPVSLPATVNLVVSGGVLRDAAGVTLPPGSMVAVVASTQDDIFRSPTPLSTLQVGLTFGGDDVVIAVFPVDALYSAASGGFVGVVPLSYATLGIPNLGAGDRLALYWFPAASLSGGQILANAAYGSYRAEAVSNKSTTLWVAPDDSTGGTQELNLLTQAVGGEADNAVALASLVIGAANDVTVAATDPTGAEPSDPGAFTFTRSGATTSPLTVNFTVSGTATSGGDCTSIGTTVVFAAGAATATLPVSVLDDLVVEGNETVVVTVAAGSGYTVGSPSSATVTILDDEAGAPVIVSVVATDPTAGEPASGQGTGTFTLSRTGPTTGLLTVNYTVGGSATSGSDFAALGTTATFAAGSATATISVNVIDDALVEGDETVTLTLGSGSGYTVGGPVVATVTIVDDESGATPSVTVAATDAAAGESGSGQATGTFTFTRTGSTAAGLTVNFTVGGTATSGTDYTAMGTTVTFAAGSSTATKGVSVIDDILVEPAETVIVTLAAGAGYAVGNPLSATVTIQDFSPHTADTDLNFRISLLELTRVIELYNTRNGTTRTGCYQVDATGEDGFAPDAARASGAVVSLPFYHSADANQDGKLSLLELTRVIELYNYRSGTTRTGQYHPQAGTEDGFAPGQ